MSTQIGSVAVAHVLGRHDDTDAFNLQGLSPLAGNHHDAALALDSARPGGGLTVHGGGHEMSDAGWAINNTVFSPIFNDYGMMPLANTKPHKTTAEAGDQLTRHGYHWNSSDGNPLTITYSFRQDAPATLPNGTAGFSQFSAGQIAATQLELKAWSDVANITFTEISDSASDPYTNHGTILYSNYSSGASGSAAFAYNPNPAPGDRSDGGIDGDVWINNSLAYNATPTRDNYGSQVLLHETGHALGMEHPGDYNASPNYVATYNKDAIYYEDSRQYTVMSYFAETNTGGNFSGDYAESPLMDDIAAMQKLYGANTTAFSGDTIYGFNSTTGADYRPYYDASLGDHLLIFCAYDTGGHDSFDFDQYNANQVIDLNTGRDHFSSVGGLINNVSIYDGTVIEDAYGGFGADKITGNDANNFLAGNAGADTLVGGAGGDTLNGGLGADNLNGGDGNDELFIDKQDTVVTGGAGEDEADINSDTYGALSFSLYEGRLDGQIEDIYADGSTGMELDGTAVANHIRATDGADLVKAMEGNDTVIGRAGADTIYAGTGDDTVWGGTPTDLLLADGGDKIYGEDGNDLLNGNLGNDTIDGGAGNDTIYGGANDDDSLLGGAGNDSIDGGSGNDTVDGGDGNNTLIGGVGNDLIRVAAGNSIVTGDAGTDELDVSFSDVVAMVHQNGDGSGTVTWSGGLTTTYSTIEAVDVTIGTSNFALGNSGQIFYVTGDGSNTVTGGSGLDILVLNYAAENYGFSTGSLSHNANGYSGYVNNPYHVINFSGIDIFQITTGSGGDNIDVGNATSTISTGAGNDVISTGTGIDNINGGGDTDGWNADLSATSTAITYNAGPATYSGPGVVTGIDYLGTFSSGSGADNITTDSLNISSNISTNGGNDTVTTVNGSDTIAMGAGTDTLIVDLSAQSYGVTTNNYVTDSSGYSGSFNNPYLGVNFSGVDRLQITTGSGGDSIIIGNLLATISTGLGDDFINSGTAIDTIDAGSSGGYDGWSANLSATSIAIIMDVTTGTYSGPGSVSGVDYFGVFSSGSGADNIVTGAGNSSENITTNAGNDTVTTVNGSDTVAMGAGTDTLIVNLSAQTYGFTTNNFVTDSSGYSGSFNNPYLGVNFSGVDRLQITTGSGGDSIVVGNLVATISTGLGDDFIDSGTAVDNLSAGAGEDGWSANLSAQTTAIILDLTAGTYSGPGAASGFEYVGVFSSGSGADNITTGSGNRSENISTNAGNDTVTTVNGSDTIAMGAGTDTLIVNLSAQTYGITTNNFAADASGYSGSFNNQYLGENFSGVDALNITTGSGGDSISIANLVATVNTGAGDDVISGGTAVDSIDGGDGVDGWSADLSATTTAMSLDLTTGAYTGPGHVTGIEYLGSLSTGSKGDLIKTAGGGHNEAIATNGGNDTVSTVDGSDTVAMGAGTDTLIVDLSVSTTGITTYNVAGSVAAGYAGEFDDTYGYNRVYFSGVEAFQFTGTSLGDNIGVGDAVATINTGAGDDFINSGAALDSLNAGTGTDGWSADLSAQTAAISLDLTTGVYSGPGSATGFEYVGVFSSGSGADLIKTASGGHNESIFTNGGADTVSTVDGSDTIAMGAGSDTLIVDLSVSTTGITTNNVAGSVAASYAGDFDDTYGYNRVYFSGVEAFQFTGTAQGDNIGLGNATATINTGAGDDFINSGTAIDSLIAGTGTDGWSADLSAQTAAISLDLTTGVYSGPGSATGFEYLGTFSSGSGADFIKTGSGSFNETVSTNGGADTVSTVAGNDTIAMGSGSDTLIVDLSISGTGVATHNFSGSAAAGYAGDYDDAYGYNRVYFSGVETFKVTGSANADALMTGDNADTIFGGAGADSLSGQGGNDSLDGGTGVDTMVGGLGNDTYVVDDATDSVVENAGEGADTVQASVSYVLADNVENLLLTGAAASGTGNALNNTITGNALANTLDGGAGIDTLVGGLGNDTYVVDSTTDVITENAGEGADTILSSVSFTSVANVEFLVLTGTADINGSGDSGANTITGNDGANSLAGGNGADTLDGAGGDDSLNGGLGADSLSGGLGDDTYFVDNLGDVVTEAASAGLDWVQAAISYVLGSNVENLTLTGAALNGTGNGLANEIDGDSNANSLVGGSGNDSLNGAIGNDTLDGGALSDLLNGGAGADSMIGGAGNDTFIVDNVGDVVVELASGGTDTVQSTISYTLGANVENLTLTGNALINGTGNEIDNTIRGSGKDNVLDGGLGNDVIVGGKGFDVVTYANASGGVNVSLAAGAVNSGAAGSDTITSVEGLTGSAFADALTGSTKGNVLDGGAGADTLTGGLGADVLTGGADADRFVFTDVKDSSTKTPDRITDLTNGDIIDLQLIDANTGASGDQAFTIVSAFSHHAGELVLTYSSATNQTLLQGDTDGDGKANFAITLDGAHTDYSNFAY